MSRGIVVERLGKQYRRYQSNRPPTIKEALLRRLRGIGSGERFWALREVTFRVEPGQMVGVIGHNGAGKSTLLRLVGGVGRPDEGTVSTDGRIGALLDLNVGFHPDLTGRENAFIGGVIAGLTRREVAQRLPAIIAFAGLEEFIDSPLRTYSTGMQMRLGFAVAIHTEPEILLIDEVLGVGDLAFQQRCLERVAALRHAGCAILFVSHDLYSVRTTCDEVVWLRAGRLVERGPAERVVTAYTEAASSETHRRTSTIPPVMTPGGIELRARENRFGSFELVFTSIRLLSQTGHPVTTLTSGAPLKIEITYHAEQPIEAPIFAITLSNEDGTVLYDTSTINDGLHLPTITDSGGLVFSIDRLDLIGGRYLLSVGCYERDWSYAYDYHWQAYPITIESTGGEKGIIRLAHRWEAITPASR